MERCENNPLQTSLLKSFSSKINSLSVGNFTMKRSTESIHEFDKLGDRIIDSMDMMPNRLKLATFIGRQRTEKLISTRFSSDHFLSKKQKKTS